MQRGFTNVLLPVLLAVLVLAFGAFFVLSTPPASESVSQVVGETKAEEETKTETETAKPTITMPTPQPKTEAPAPAPTAAPRNHPYFAPNSDPKNDVLVLTAATPNLSIDLAGWRVRSTTSGKSFVMPTVLSRAETAQTMQIRLGNTGHVAVIHSVGGTHQNYFASGQYHLYFAEPVSAWGKEHDTIQLVSPAGVVMDSYTY